MDFTPYTFYPFPASDCEFRILSLQLPICPVHQRLVLASETKTSIPKSLAGDRRVVNEPQTIQQQ